MITEHLIKKLLVATGPSRELDAEIAQATGWFQSTHDVVGDGLGTRVLWISPVTNKPEKIPSYTMYIQSAYNLSQQLCPGSSGGCRWDGKRGSARIDEDEIVEAANPAIALCVAALRSSTAQS